MLKECEPREMRRDLQANYEFAKGGKMQTILIAAIIVFVLNAVGSFIEFNNRFVNALVDTVLFAVVFWALIHFGVLHMEFSAPATTPAVAPTAP